MTLHTHNYSFCRCSVSSSNAPDCSEEQASPEAGLAPATPQAAAQEQPREAAGGSETPRRMVAMAGSSLSTLELWHVSDQVRSDIDDVYLAKLCWNCPALMVLL